jgi:hypothetical protein
MTMGMPATRAYIAQLDAKAAEMERQADEAEALAAGRGATGSSAWHALNALDHVDALRARARDCREKAQEQRQIVAQYDR